MPTELDALQIRIESDSTNAASGIRALASSLGELKKSGTVTTAIKNLDKLSESLKNFADASNATRSIGKLVGSLQKLKEVGSVGNIGTNLNKITAGLKGVETINVDGIAPKIQGIVAAIAPLSTVKAGGIGTMVNALSKIGKVTESLDDDKINAFAERVEKLSNVLGPLSTKMTTISAGFKGINSGARSAGSSVKQMGKDIDGASVNMSSFIYIIQQAVQWLQQAIDKFSKFMGEAIEWDGIAARFGRGFGDQAQETYEWIQRLNEEMGINVQQFMKYSSVYATMLTGFGVANEDATKMALGYTELTYDIWAGYNDIYKNFDDAAEAVKSAIAGEVEPIRRAGFTIVESTLEQTAANHGLEISIYNATEAEKSYLRYLTLVDQAHSQSLVGSYAKELNTAEGLTRTLSQQLKSLTQAFGSLFLPVLVRIMPWIQAFVELLTEAVYWLAGLFGVEIQEVDWSGFESGAGALDNVAGSAGDAGDALGSAAQAAKDLQKATLGIDELNVISPTTSSTGSGGSGGGTGVGSGFTDLDIDSLWDESIFKNIESQVDAIKEKIKGWLPLLGTLASVFGGITIAGLLAQMAEGMEKLKELDTASGKLKKQLAGLAILTIEAFLVFMLSDEYLETGNFMALVGEALATAAGGYLMYKGFGVKGLAMALGVSIAAQLVAITLNLADGGVEFDDPELWIQSAFTTVLAGVSGGILAYKGFLKMSTGQGVGFGLLAGLSLTLASITIGEVTANGFSLESAVTGALSTLAGGAAGAALVTFLGIATGGTGFLIGAAAMLAINVIGGAIGTVSKNFKKSVEDDLEDRFGEIELTIEEVNAYVDKITAIPRNITIDANVWNETSGKFEVQTMTVPVDVAFEIFDEENAVLDSLRSKVNGLAEKISRDAMKITLGIDISQDEMEKNVESYVSSAQEYLDQYYLTTNIAIGLSVGDSSAGLASTLATFYSTNSAKLSELGTKLKQTVSAAFVDGEWIPNKLQEALEIQQEMQEILDYTSDVEFRATIENLKLEVSGTDLTPGSFQKVLDGSREAIEKKLESLEEVKMSKLQVAVMQYDANIDAGMSEAEAKKIYDQTVADIEAEYQNGKIEVTYGSVDFGLVTLKEAFAEELKNTDFNIGEEIKRVLNDQTLSVDIMDEGENPWYSGADIMVGRIFDSYEMAVKRISPEVRKNLESLLEKMQPTMTDYEEIAETSRKAGTAVPQSVRDGLNDYYELKALSNDAAGINYVIGQQLSTDTSFLNTLATAGKAGRNIDDAVAKGLLNNIEYVKDEASGVVTGIKNSMTGEVVKLTPELVENFERWGVDLSAGLAEGIEKDEPTLFSKLKSWGGKVVQEVKNFFQIKSPSKVFSEIGGYLSDGLNEGMESNSIKDGLSSMWSTAKGWWDNKTDLKTYTPAIGSIKDKLSSAWTTAKTWYDNKKSGMKTYTPSIGSIYEKAKDRWDSAKEWWDKKKSAMKTYTPSIGSIYEKTKDRWDNARTWWNSKKAAMKTYTPSIGSITDKLKSAWSSAKSWWNKNVSLSTKLNIQVPTIKVNWETATAFGKSFKYPTGFKLNFAADGGMFDQGSLIWAGERGAEVVANASGGKTGVMNVQQMEEAVYEGVYAAFMAARGSSNGESTPAFNIYIDGKQVTAAVEKRQRERGASIMGNQVYNY